MGKHTSKNDLVWHKENGCERAYVTLFARDSTWNPASTARYIYGPCQVTYVRYPDGGIDAIKSKIGAA